jgi:hypothetical protein
MNYSKYEWRHLVESRTGGCDIPLTATVTHHTDLQPKGAAAAQQNLTGTWSSVRLSRFPLSESGHRHKRRAKRQAAPSWRQGWAAGGGRGGGV